MRLWAGYSQVSDPEFKSNNGIEERDFFKCCHCGSYEFVVPKQTDFTRCYSCDDGMGGGLICKKCVENRCYLGWGEMKQIGLALSVRYNQQAVR